MPPNIKWRNADERAIQTFKNYFIAVFCSVNPISPLKFKDILLDQETTTMNMMHNSIINTNISVHEKFFGIFNFNRTPFPPPGTRILVHAKPENKSTYAPHGSDEWYIGSYTIDASNVT